jgi:transposase-like protein
VLGCPVVGRSHWVRGRRAVVVVQGAPVPGEVISHCVWLYHWFPLSLREVEEMMTARGGGLAVVGGV